MRKRDCSTCRNYGQQTSPLIADYKWIECDDCSLNPENPDGFDEDYWLPRPFWTPTERAGLKALGADISSKRNGAFSEANRDNYVLYNGNEWNVIQAAKEEAIEQFVHAAILVKKGEEEEIRLGDFVVVRKSQDQKEMKRAVVIEIVTTTEVSLVRTYESKMYVVRFINLDKIPRGMRRKVEYGVYRSIDLRVVWTMKNEYEQE